MWSWLTGASTSTTATAVPVVPQAPPATDQSGEGAAERELVAAKPEVSWSSLGGGCPVGYGKGNVAGEGAAVNRGR